MTKKCVNCPWIGGQEEVVGQYKHCPVCGDNTEDTDIKILEPKKEEVTFDLDGDGDFDKDDASLGAKAMAKMKGLKRGKKK